VTFTVIPAKPFDESKTRLASVLTPEQRISFSQHLLEHTIGVAAQLSQVVVVSRSMAVLQTATRLGVQALIEEQPDLNAAVRQGIAWSQAQGGSRVLILPIDLPLLTTIALADLINRGLQHCPNIVIAPCRRHQGTNALFLNPATLINPHFGATSFADHQKLARQAGVVPEIYRTPELAFDLDTLEDWQELETSKSLLAGNLCASQFV
jgi:2-phospho-L-lactate guanylyltransferase